MEGYLTFKIKEILERVVKLFIDLKKKRFKRSKFLNRSWRFYFTESGIFFIKTKLNIKIISIGYKVHI